MTSDKLDDLRRDLAANILPTSSREDIEKIVEKYSDSNAKNREIENEADIYDIFSTNGTIHDLMARLDWRCDV